VARRHEGELEMHIKDRKSIEKEVDEIFNEDFCKRVERCVKGVAEVINEKPTRFLEVQGICQALLVFFTKTMIRQIPLVDRKEFAESFIDHLIASLQASIKLLLEEEMEGDEDVPCTCPACMKNKTMINNNITIH
jgi:hypothetical protein